MIKPILCLALGLIALPADAAERRDVVIAQGHIAGSQKVSDAPDGSVTTDYRYTDRDHGDSIQTRWTIDSEGIPTSYDAGGHDYMHARVADRFSLNESAAEWENSHGKGTRILSRPAFYMPANPVPEYYGVLARALLKSPGHTLDLLPTGTATLEAVDMITVDSGGSPTVWRQYRIAGLAFMPYPVWLDQDGNTVAVASLFLAAVASGHERDVAALMESQDKVEQAWHARVAEQLADVPKAYLLIRGARVFDPRTLRVRPGLSVLVRGERIVAVGPEATIRSPRENTQILDARGRFLMPGLWDVHAHLDGVDGLLNIANGVTSVRDLGNDLDIFAKRVARYEAGTEIGPNVMKAGFIDREGLYAAPLPVRVNSLAEALQWVDWYADHGYVQIKTYMSMDPAWIAPIAERAHARGMRVSGHVPAFMSAKQFVDAGADEIQHFNYVELDFLYPRIQETTQMQNRFIEVGLHAVEATPESDAGRALITFFKQHKTVLDPTMSLLEARLAGSADDVAPGLRALAPRLPQQVRNQLTGGAYEAPAGQEAAYAQAIPAMLKLLGSLHAAGVRILPGTDALAGYTLHHELELYARAGIKPAEVLRLATLTPAEVMGVAEDRGTITAGQRADMILIDGDPTQDIADIRKIETIVKGGRIFKRREIEDALGILPAP